MQTQKLATSAFRWGLLGLIISAVQVVAGELPSREETWQVIYMNQQRVGYARSVLDSHLEGDTPVVTTLNETHMALKRFGQTLQMKTMSATEETLDGELRQFRLDMQNPPAQTSTIVGKITGSELQLTSTVNGKTSTRQVPWKSGVKSPAYQDRWLREQRLQPGDVREFEAYLPEFQRVARIKIEAVAWQSTTLLENQPAELLLLRISNSLLPGVMTSAWVDAQGNVLKSSTQMLGTEMVIYTVSKDQAMQALGVAELDLGVNTLIRTGKITAPHQTKRIVYHITIRDEDAVKVLPQTPTQQVRPGPERQTAEVIVTRLNLPSSSQSQTTPAAEYIQANEYLQADDDYVAQHAQRATQGINDPVRQALAMERYVHDKLTNKNFSTALASAAEVARSLEGDCTEHACLLAAMLRNRGIPSRVVVGLVYVERDSAFGGHMWTEAWLHDQWVPLDATLGLGGIGAAHIRLADSSFAESAGSPLTTFAPLLSIIGKLSIRVVSVE
ncbi:MAG: hypothetical protein KatS3mg114_0032 [Planctomycetaceae bacterium]|nr:MAG: hypothetical protein KatS3mg114_0032 [Planctomycetaceae bacterium]